MRRPRVAHQIVERRQRPRACASDSRPSASSGSARSARSSTRSRCAHSPKSGRPGGWMWRDGVSMCAKVTVIAGVPRRVRGGARRMQDEVMDQQIRSPAQIERRPRRSARSPARAARWLMIRPCCELIARVEDLQADLDLPARGSSRTGEATARAVKPSDAATCFVAPIADLGVEQLDVRGRARASACAERDERADVAFAAPGLNADAHVSLLQYNSSDSPTLTPRSAIRSFDRLRSAASPRSPAGR